MSRLQPFGHSAVLQIEVALLLLKVVLGQVVVPPVLPLTTQEPAVPAGGTYHVHPETVIQVACVIRLPQPVVAPPQSTGQRAAVSVL